jgi:hypothetical protein
VLLNLLLVSGKPLGEIRHPSGTSSVKHLDEENIAAASVKLDDAAWRAIEDDAKQK